MIGLYPLQLGTEISALQEEAEELPAGAQNMPCVWDKGRVTERAGISPVGRNLRDLHPGVPSSFVLRMLLTDASINSYFAIMRREVLFWGSI